MNKKSSSLKSSSPSDASQQARNFVKLVTVTVSCGLSHAPSCRLGPNPWPSVWSSADPVFHRHCCLWQQRPSRLQSESTKGSHLSWWIIYLDKTKTSPPGFSLYRKWNISNILAFLFFNRIHFNLVPGTASHVRIHVLVTHTRPSQPEEHTVKKAQWESIVRSANKLGLISVFRWSLLNARLRTGSKDDLSPTGLVL